MIESFLLAPAALKIFALRLQTVRSSKEAFFLVQMKTWNL